MSKKITIPKEYAIKVSLIIFFALVTLVGGIRLTKVINGNNEFDLSKIDIVESDDNADFTSINLGISDAIRKKYGIDVYYGDNLNLDSVDAVPITDQSIIFEMLKKINMALEKYPEDLVNEIESKGYSVSIYLVRKFNGDLEALANRNTVGQFKIYVSNTVNLERAIHHEFYHILDYYIKLETSETYATWTKYNPTNFKYPEDVNMLTLDNVFDGKSGANFVTLYSKFSLKEDRAETFAEMETAPATSIIFNNKEPIKGKINLINEVLINTFKTINQEANVIKR